MAETNENYGGFWIRFLAYIVDGLIVGIAFFLIVMLLTLMGLELISPELIYFALLILYWAFMQASPRQATYGKSLVGLKVTGYAGERISFARALAREAAKILSTLTLLIGFIIAGFTKRKQSLHDFIASTYVVRTSPGHVVAAVAVALVALFAPVIVVMFVGVGLVAGLMGGMAGALMSGPEITMQVPKPPAAPSPPVAKPQAIQAPAPAPAAKAVPVSAPAPTMAAPVVLAQAPEQPTPAPAKEPAKPVAKEEPIKPVAKEPAKEAPKPVAKKSKPAAKEPASVVAGEEAAKPAPAPRKAREPAAVPMQTAAAPTVGTLRFNDLVTAVLYRDAGAVNDLLAFGKWPDKADSRGMTPLMLAAMLGDAPIAEALLKAGANPNLPGPGGDTAMSIARERKDAGMVGLLRQHGAR
jgi:uncharacterized RDD family membrane protein YckC